jgi:hypothetical protein
MDMLRILKDFDSTHNGIVSLEIGDWGISKGLARGWLSQKSFCSKEKAG